MKFRLVAFVFGMGLSGMSFAQDETALVVPTSDESTFRYGYSHETYENAAGDVAKTNWFTARSGHLTGGIDRELNKYRLRLNANGAELVGAQATDIGKKYLSRFQVELGAETNRSPYGLLALELPIMTPLNLFVGSIHNPGGTQRFVVGPIMYWSESHTMILYYPKADGSDSVVDSTLVVKNRVREFGKLVWLDVDLSSKQVSEGNQVDGFVDYGYGATIGVWKMYAKYATTPYWEGTKVAKTAYEFGVDASF